MKKESIAIKSVIIICIIYITILVFSSSCVKAKKYDITGTWIFSRSFDNIEVFLDDTSIEFIGSDFSGTVTVPATNNFGTYDVSISNDINFTLNNRDATYTGTWTDENNIGGTFYWNEKGDSGTWSAAR